MWWGTESCAECLELLAVPEPSAQGECLLRSSPDPYQWRRVAGFRRSVTAGTGRRIVFAPEKPPVFNATVAA